MKSTIQVAALCFTLGATAMAADTSTAPAASSVTFYKDIVPILQRSCQNCHQPDGAAPMALITYQQARPWAKAMKERTALRDRRGVMPPWYIEKNIGIQHYKNDTSLSDEQIAKIAKWADSGAPAGNPADAPPPKPVVSNADEWTLGTPDLILATPEVTVKAGAPDWWGELDPTPTGLTEDRYVKSVEMREINDVPRGGSGRKTVGGRFVFHHMIWSTRVPGEQSSLTDVGGGWPIHEVGRNGDIFPDNAGMLLRAHSELVFSSTHLHSNGRDTHSRLEYGFRFFPKGYKPTVKWSRSRSVGNGVDIDIKPNTANQRFEAYSVLQENTEIVSFEPHMHAPGVRMCLEAIWGINVQTLTCAGYDHNWVRVYDYDEDYAPLLPKGTILHIIGWFDTTPANFNVTDPRDWTGSGNRSITNMFIDLGRGLALTDDQFYAEMARRREKLHITANDDVIGCPLCNGDPIAPPVKNTKMRTNAPASGGNATAGSGSQQ